MKQFNVSWFERKLDDYVAEHFSPPTHVIMNPTAFAEYFERMRPAAYVIYRSPVHGDVAILPSPYLVIPGELKLGNTIMMLDFCFGALWREPVPDEPDYAGWTLGADDAPISL